MRPARGTRVIAAALFLPALAASASANTQSDALRARATVEVYNLDLTRAAATYREAIAVDPEDAAAYRGLAVTLWLNIAFARGNMTVDDYLGGVSRQSVAGRPAPPDLVQAFNAALEQALALGRKRVAARPQDADGYYQVGAAIGLRASYIATVEGSARRAFGAAREAYDSQERVLKLDPSRKDAGLIVGTYRYVVSVLSLPLRWAAYVAGFGGGKERGIQMIEDAAAYGGENADDARFSLVLLYNREKQYDLALRHLDVLRGRYPRNHLLWLETGATLLRAGRAADAERTLTERFSRFADDRRDRMFGEEALSFYKRGAARAVLNRREGATEDLRRALALEGRKWVHGRAHLELGKLALQRGDRTAALEELQTAATLCDADNDAAAAAEARRLLARP